jgi:NAD+ diphosphatase
MLGFTATVDDPDRVRADGEEVLEVRWFTRAELAEAAASGEVVLSGQISIARSLIEHWYGGPLAEAPR